MSIHSASIGTRWKAGGREEDEREIAGLSSRAANKEDGSELSLGEADKEEDGEAANKRKMAPSYHSEKRTKKKANFALSREEADKEGEDSELADDGG